MSASAANRLTAAARRFSTRLRCRVLTGATSMLLVFTACGADDSSAPSPVDSGARDASCGPRLPNPWLPTWRPPRAMLHACSDAQIETEFRLCESESTYSATACATWSRDVANAACRRCLYTTEDEDAYGAFIYLRNRILRINVAGCLALADGQLGPSGCGAQFHAFQTCGDAACMTACAAYADFTECVTRAEDGVCAAYRVDSACGEPATYAPCIDYPTFAEYYRGVAKLFCGGGFPGRGDAGTNDAGRDGDVARSTGQQKRAPSGPSAAARLLPGHLPRSREIEAPFRLAPTEGVAR